MLHDAKTQLVFHLPNPDTSTSGNKISWQTDNGQDVSLTSFLSSDYTTRIINEQTESVKFLGPIIHDHQYKYQLRLVSAQKAGHQTMMNVVHTGSDASVVQYTSDAGEKAEGVLIESGAEGALAIFNGDAGERPYSINGTLVAIEATAPNDRGRAGHDPLRQSKNEKLRFFKTGFNLSFNAQKTKTNIYLMDLNPLIQWKITVDGIVRNLTPGDTGSLVFSIASTGNHTINIVEVGNVIPANILPNAQNAQYSLDAGSQITRTLLASDSDGDPLSYQVIDEVSKGTLILNASSGTFTYALTDAASASDQFTFKVNDGKGDSNIAAVSFVLNDRDGDHVLNAQDAFPDDPAEWLDTDADGVGNNADLDDDNDGMPDTWELQYGLDPLDAADAHLDSDNDGDSNLQEYNNGTDPLSKNKLNRTLVIPAVLGFLLD